MRTIAWAKARHALLLATFAAAALPAQPATRHRDVDGRASCASCVIERVRVARIGGAGDSLHFTVYGRISLAVDSRGRIYLGPQRPAGAAGVTVFDQRGRAMRSMLPRGGGPGESYGPELFVVGAGDSLHVLDAGRASVFAPNHQLTRSGGWPPVTATSAAVLRSGNIVISGNLATADGAGFPAHLVSPAGNVIRSFGARAPAVRAEDDLWFARSVAAGAGDSTVWISNLVAYRMEQWDVRGRLVQSLSRDVSWFRPLAPGTANYSRDTGPGPTQGSVWQDSAGFVWTRISVTDPNWRSAGQQLGGEGGVAIRSSNDFNGVYDTVIEVIDPGSARLVASQRFPEGMKGFVAGGFAFSAMEDANGIPYVDVWRFRLRR